jgi:hypothetical protein
VNQGHVVFGDRTRADGMQDQQFSGRRPWVAGGVRDVYIRDQRGRRIDLLCA